MRVTVGTQWDKRVMSRVDNVVIEPDVDDESDCELVVDLKWANDGNNFVTVTETR